MNTVFPQRHPGGAVRRVGRGFTLIELMVVMGIISLLVAIALPAFSAARKNARKVTSEATISVLATGLEQFNADTTVGGSYPPSVHLLARNPHATTDREDPVYGANLLVWALAGADLLGTPGFRDLDGETDAFGGWRSDTTRMMQSGGNNPYLYTINPSNGRPAVSRSGPYVDMSKVKVAKQNKTNPPTFQMPSAPSTGLASQVFLDSFDQPILYYKANTGAPGMVGSGGAYIDFLGTYHGGMESDYKYDNTGRYMPTAIYNLYDNDLFTGPNDNGGGTGLNFGAGATHPMGYLGRCTSFTGTSATFDKTGSFAQHLWNASITASLRPQRDDSYILISPGPDGLFGSADDVTNFPLNK